MKQALLDLAQELISVPSTADNSQALEKVITIAQREFDDQKFFIRRLTRNNKPSLIVTMSDTTTPDIFLNGHLDVVPGTKEQFKPTIIDNQLHGRGAHDMKAACAVMILLMKNLMKTDIPKDRVGLMLVTDEEIGGFDGTKYVLENGYKPKKLFIAGEATDLDIEIEAKGILWLKITFRGKAAHGAYPWKGDNPLYTTGQFLTALATKFPAPQEEAWQTTITPTRIYAGEATNQIPHESAVYLDIRHIPQDTPETIIKDIKELLPAKSTLEILAQEAPHHIDRDNKDLLRLQSIVPTVTNTSSSMIQKHGGSDARFYSKAGIPACCFGPLGRNLHQHDEYVLIDSLVQYYEILKKFCLDS